MDDYLKTVERRLKRFSPQDSKVLADWLRSKPVGINLALQFLEQIEDLAKITGKTPASLLSELLVEVSASELHSKELGRRLRDAMDRRLHPQRQAHEAVFAAWVEGLMLPPGVALKPPQNFEGRTFCLQIPFSTPQDLAQAIEGVEVSLEQSEIWARMDKI